MSTIAKNGKPTPDLKRQQEKYWFPTSNGIFGASIWVMMRIRCHFAKLLVHGFGVQPAVLGALRPEAGDAGKVCW